MRYPFPVRLLLALAVSLVLAALLIMLLYATELGFEVWTHLKGAPLWFTATYAAGLTLIPGTGIWLVWHLLSARAKRPPPQAPSTDVPHTPEEMEERINRAELAGVDVETARRELKELHSRQSTGEVFVALFGQVSTGKSSLVRALLPAAQPAVDVRAGTTRRITRYTWTCPAEDHLVITDLPGLNEPDGSLDALAREEAQRAHVVIYVVDGDLTRDQHQELQALLGLDKPLILALNKADRYGDKELVLNKVDRYSREDRELLLATLRERTQTLLPPDRILAAAADPAERIYIQVDAHGEETKQVKRPPPDVAALREQLWTILDNLNRSLNSAPAPKEKLFSFRSLLC